MENLLKMLEYDDLNPGLKIIADVSGLDAVRNLILNYPCERIYIPYAKNIHPLVKRYIKSELKKDKPIDKKAIIQRFNCSSEFLNKLIREIYSNK